MRYRKLGHTGLSVSEIGFGTIPIFYFFDNSVSLPAMYGIIVGTCVALLIIYILIVILKNKNVSFKFFDKIKNKFRKKLISKKD